jgi:hypothetical protein
MARHRGRHVHLQHRCAILVVAALLLGACGSGAESDASGADGLGSDVVETDTGGSGGSGASVETGGKPENDGAAEDSAAQDGGNVGTEINNDGPFDDNLILPGEPGFLEALGVSGVRVTRTRENSTEVTEFDRSGTAHGIVTYSNDTTAEAWLSDGEIFEVKDGLSLPRMYGTGLIRRDATIGVFFKDELLDMLVPGDEVTDDEGNPRREHRADPEQLLAFHEADSPEQWEWRSAELYAVTNPAGGLIRLEHRQEFLLVSPDNMVDPPPPREEIRTEVYTVEPYNEPVTFPADGPHPDTEDHLVTEILRLGEVSHDSALTDSFLSGSTDPITADRLNTIAEVNQSPIFRFVDGFTEFDNADQRTIGYANDGILVLQAESGKWFCIAARLSISEPSRFPTNDDGSIGDKVYLEATGDVPEDVAFDCRQQRTDFIGANG